MAQFCPLPFGNECAVFHLGAESAAASMSTVLPTLQMLSTNEKAGFVSKSANAMVGSRSLLAHASSPCQLDIEQAEGWHLVVPYVGSGSIKSGGKQFDIKAGLNAVVLPNNRRQVSKEVGSTAIFSIDKNQVKNILNSSKFTKFEYNEAFNINFDNDKNRFRSFLAICELINLNFNDQSALDVLGIDNLIDRWLVSCLQIEEVAQESRVERARIDVVCDIIRSSVDRPLTLTDMEQASGLSARALQYAFKARFGCTPMQWQRNERLTGAQQRILSMHPNESITAVAHAMGFSSSSAFTALYKRQYGETPSETILRRM